MDQDKKKNQINIELKDDIAQGIYSNLAVISHSSSEFVLDFIRIMPGTPKANVKSRIILAPEHAKRLLMALEDNLRKYESVFGTVNLNNMGNNSMPPMNFGRGPVGEA